MTRLPLILALTACAAALVALPAGAYEFMSQDVGTGVSPGRWQTLPINLVLDNGPTDIAAEIGTALTTWNAVSTARDPFGTVTRAAEDFTGTNYTTAWGNLTGDGRYEVVFDEDGSGARALGFAPGSINGIGLRHDLVVNGTAVIDDMFLLVNGTGTPVFDRRSTEVHELGHTLGLAHSTVGWPLGKDGALSPVLQSQVPTMHPFATDIERRTLEADDRAALSELYPEASFTATTGTINGKVTRCGSGEPVLGANVRAIKVDDPATQLTRVTGFDGKTDGSYEINGVPPGDYFVVVEPLAGDAEFFGRLALYTDEIDTDFEQEYLNESKEPDCTQDSDPDERESIPVAASAETPADLKVQGATLALVIDVTGSMGPEIGSVKTSLETMIDTLEDGGGRFPRTAIVTFEDTATVRAVSDDPDRLRSVIAGLSTHSTPDCPEGSNAALMTAARLLASGGKAVLATDADSHPTGPSRTAVDALYTSKGVRLSVLLSGSCPPPPSPAKTAAAFASDPGPDQARPPDALGVENSVRTFSEESLFSGGLFSFQPEIKTSSADAKTRYANTLANVAISAVSPAVAAVSPSAVPQGTTLDVELVGSNTGFRAGSAVTVDGAGVSVASVAVLSPTRMVVRLVATSGATAGFRDVTVRTDRGDGSIETAHGIGAVQVVGPVAAPTVLSVTPSTLAVGSTRDVTISGGSTHFGATSVVGLGAGVTVNRVSVVSPTSLVVNVTVAPSTGVGFRDVTVSTGGELAGENVPGPVLVTAVPPPIARLVGASPGSGARGTTVRVTISGDHTAFASGASRASVTGSGVEVLSTVVNNATELVAQVRIAPDAPLGFRDVRVTTAGATIALPDGFEVTPALPVTVTPAPVTVTPAPVTVTPAPVTTPAASGGSPHPVSACVDRTAPSAAFVRVRVVRRRPSLRGRAGDLGCGGSVARVEVAISRAAGRRCRFVNRSGKLTAARRCSAPIWLKAVGTTTWSFGARRALARGKYTLHARAVDAAGNVQRALATNSLRVR